MTPQDKEIQSYYSVTNYALKLSTREQSRIKYTNWNDLKNY